MSKERDAVTVLARFAPQLGWTVKSVMRSFGLAPSFYDDVEQEANILVITYAGLMDNPSWGVGRLAKFEEQAKGDESQVKHLVGKQLRIDLTQIVSRMIDRNASEAQLASLDAVTDTSWEPTDTDWEDRQVADVDNSREIERYRRKYPTLAMNILDGMTQSEIAREREISVATVERRISAEKRAFIVDAIKRRGLTVEGNETTEELEEAYNNLTKAGR